MKKYFFIIPAISLLLASCATKADIESLQQQINNLTNTQIATINMQIANIQKSIGDLSEVDRELKGFITGLRADLEGLDGEVGAKYQELNLALDALENEDALLDQRIKDLKTYCDQQDNGVKSWVTTTFATLEQHGAVLTEMAGIKTRLGELTQMISDLDTSLSQKISEAEGRLNAAIVSSESSVKAWVNEKLADYYTIAQIEAKLKILEDGYKEGDESLSTEISTLRGSLETAKTELTTAYQTAITTAIEQNNGVINAKIAADIKTASDALQAQIDEMKGRLDIIESRLLSLEASVAELIGMVQSIVVVPDYSDGSVRISGTTNNTIRFEVYPLAAAAAIAEKGPSILSLDYVETTTKASSILANLPITAVSYTDALLVLSVDGSGLPESVMSGSVSANARLKISDGNITKSSEYFPLTITEEPIPEEAVDLGIVMTRGDGTTYKLYWAKSNLSDKGLCANPEDYGDYYAWGETEPYYTEGHSQDNPCSNWRSRTNPSISGYNWASYKWCNGSYTSLTKYNTSSSYGTVDNKKVLDPEDDVAHINLSGKWRMPTDDEWQELLDNCTWAWTDNYNGTGVSGRIVTAKNGNSIFLPAAASRFDTDLGSADSGGGYWSSSLFTSSDRAWIVYFSSRDMGRGYDARCYGFSIRPVYGEDIHDDDIPVTGISLSPDASACAVKIDNGAVRNTECIGVGATQVFNVTVNPLDAPTNLSIQSQSGSATFSLADGKLTVKVPSTATASTKSSKKTASVVLKGAGGYTQTFNFQITKFDPYQVKEGDVIAKDGSIGDGGYRGNQIFEDPVYKVSKANCVIAHLGDEHTTEDPLWNDYKPSPALTDQLGKGHHGIAIPVSITKLYRSSETGGEYYYTDSGNDNYIEDSGNLPSWVKTTDRKALLRSNSLKHSAYMNTCCHVYCNAGRGSSYEILPFNFFVDDMTKKPSKDAGESNKMESSSYGTFCGAYSSIDNGFNASSYSLETTRGMLLSPWLLPTIADFVSVFTNISASAIPANFNDYNNYGVSLVEDKIDILEQSIYYYTGVRPDYDNTPWWLANETGQNKFVQGMISDGGAKISIYKSVPHKDDSKKAYVLPIRYF